MGSTVEKYSAPARVLHGVSALLILAMIPIGLVMTRIGKGVPRLCFTEFTWVLGYWCCS